MPDGSQASREKELQRGARQSDGQLIAACLAGNEAAWSALIGRYKGLIFGLALKMGLSQDDAADALQDVSVTLVQHLATLRDAERLGPWLTITTKREVWRLLKKRSARSGVTGTPLDALAENEMLPDADADTPEEVLLALEEMTLARRALDALPPDCRRLLTCLYSLDPPLTHVETARKLQMPLGSVGAAQKRCLKQMRKFLEEIGFMDK